MDPKPRSAFAPGLNLYFKPMSKITYSGIGITESSGTLANEVYSKNRGGHFKRAHVIPFFPNTLPQQGINNAFTVLTSVWQSIDQWMRDEWNLAADQVYKSNPIGNSYRLSGFNLFIQQTLNISIAGGMPTLLPIAPTKMIQPAVAKVETLNTLQMKVSVYGFDIAFSVPTDLTMSIFATTAVSAGINYKQTGFVNLASLEGPNSSAFVDVYTSYISYYPIPVTGKKIFFRAKYYSKVTGQASLKLDWSGIVS